jgi:phosphonate transport system permease protein
MSDLRSALRERPAPARLRRPNLLGFLITLGAVALAVHAISAGAIVAPGTLLGGIGRTGEFATKAFPPDLDRIGAISLAMLETFEIALLGTALGVILSIPLAVLAARNTAPHPVVYAATRGLIAFLRSVPDLVWGLIFVVTVGLGPEAGVLAIAVDTAGFCARFFADRIEDVDPDLIESLTATGASRAGILAGAVIPSLAPAFTGISMFALEMATRSSVVLGVVGAGGIGVELTTSMQLLRYSEALTIVLFIFVVVLGVERLAASIRKRLGVQGTVAF